MIYDKEVYHFLSLHFPIALFITGYIFHILFIFLDKIEFEQYILWTMGMGILWSLVSIITGYITAIEMEYISSFMDILQKRGINKHSHMMILATGLFIATFILINKKINIKILLFIHSLAVILLIYGTHLGAKWAERI